MDTTTCDPRPAPSPEDMRAVETLARKEHGRRATLEGWRLTCSQGTRPYTRLSFDLNVEQPVLVQGTTVAWATGFEVGDSYEVRLGTIHGPLMYAHSLVPCSEHTLERRRALALAQALHQALADLHHHTEDVETRGSINVLRGKADRIASRLERL